MEAILVVRPHPLEEQRKSMAKLLSRKKARRCATASKSAKQSPVTVAAIFRDACAMDLEGIVSKTQRVKMHRMRAEAGHGSRRRTRISSETLILRWSRCRALDNLLLNSLNFDVPVPVGN